MKRHVQVTALVMDSYGLTIKGRSRSHNEDAILWPPLIGCDEDGVRRYLVALADGVGGGPLGEVASATAIESLRKTLGDGVQGTVDTLEASFASANEAVLEMARRESAEGPATTLLAVLVTDDRAWVANVGDSRAYLVRQGRIRQITEDHLLMTERASSGGRARSALTRAIGTKPTPSVDIFGPFDLRARDSIVLCSDGLHGAVEPANIGDAVSRPEPRDGVEQLGEVAAARSGDDISIIVCKFVSALRADIRDTAGRRGHHAQFSPS